MSKPTSPVGGTKDVDSQSSVRASQLAQSGGLSDLDIGVLRHPYEPSRFGVALVGMAVPIAVAVFVLVSLGEATMLVTFLAIAGVALLTVWLLLQVWRARLLGDAVLVSEETLPELQQVIDTARWRVGYTRPLRVFVVDKMSTVLAVDAAPITLTNFFGIRVLIAEGASLGDLADERDRQRLLFIMATYIGALKARYARWWSPLFTAFQMTGLTAFAQPFVNTYYRATVLSGDRIAYATCGDLDISLEAVYRAMVGKEVAVHLRAAGLTGQALAARRRWLLRFAQLLRPTPHATNRYLELLAFISQSAPDEFDAHRSALGVEGPQAGQVLAALGRRKSHEAAAAVGVALAATVLLAGAGLGLTARNSSVAVALAETYGWPPSGSSAGDAGSEASSAPKATETGSGPTSAQSTSTSSPGDPDVEDLLARAGADPSYRCTPSPGPADGLLAAVTCESLQAPGGAPAELGLRAYTTPSAMRAAVQTYAGNLPEGTCQDDQPGKTTWSRNGEEKGALACLVLDGGDRAILWASDDTGVLAYASDPSMSLSSLYTWWTTTPVRTD